jgi:lantibiotic biosynthesis protein
VTNNKGKPLYTGRQLPLVAGRTPLLPVEKITRIFAAENPLEELRSFLRREPLTRHAMYVASPSLSDAVESWISGADEANQKAQLRALAYVSRMASRPTPLGLCAGIGRVAAGERTTLSVALERRRTHTRPDMGFIGELTKGVQTGGSGATVWYITNPAALVRGDRLYVTNVTLVSAAEALGNATEQRPISLRNTKAVQLVRDVALAGERYESIVARLVDRFSAQRDEAASLVDHLIEAGVLISEFAASPVGNTIEYLLERFEAVDPPLGASLRSAVNAAQQLDKRSLDLRALDDYSGVAAQFAHIHADYRSALTQTDLHSPFDGTLNDQVLDDAATLGEYLVRMSPVKSLVRYRERFEARYEGLERMVPLLELIDPNLGLGFPESPEAADADTGRDAVLAAVASEAIHNGAEEIELCGDRLSTVIPPLQAQDQSQVPESMEVGVQIAARSREAVDCGDYLVVSSGLVATERAGRSLGRFLHLLGPETTDRVATMVREGDSQSLPAELAFVPSPARSYNVAMRPRLLDCEIQIGIGNPGSVETIALDDLWVGVRNGKFYLWSASRKCVVEPRESHVFATETNAPNICRFLAALAHEGRRRIRPFDWGSSSRLTYLPRLRVGRLVLAVRQWRFETDCLKLKDEVAPTLRALRTTWNMPRYVLLGELSTYLLVDLDSPVAGPFVRSQLGRDAQYIVFREALPAPDAMWVPSGEGNHVVEFAISVVRRAPIISSGPFERRGPILDRTRYGVGSRWLYVKFYAAPQAVDDFIVRRVAPFVKELRAAALLDRWFFVRYVDTAHHLRVRLRSAVGKEAELRDRTIALGEEWMQLDLVQRYAFDTYDPEYERYDYTGSMEAVEGFFCTDSDRCVELLFVTPDVADMRVAAAARSFYPFVLEEQLNFCAMRTLQPLSRRKLNAVDRAQLKHLAQELRDTMPLMDLVNIIPVPSHETQLASFFHLHCNRLGLNADGEARAMLLLRALLLSHNA